MLNIQQISKTDSNLLPTLFKSIEDNRVFKKAEYRESFIKNINQLLSLRESRQTALSTLNIFCDHHSVGNASVITEKTSPEINWIEQLLKFIDQEQAFHSECFEILAKLLKITSCNPDTNKIVQSKFVQKIIEAIIGSKCAPRASLSCLATCFELHGGTSGIYKNKIYDYCVSFVDVPDDGIAEQAGYCLHLLQQSRGGSVAGGVYKKCWAEFHEKTVGSLENMLEQITKKAASGNIGKSEMLQLPELKLSPEPFNRYTQLFVRFQNVVTILRVSLERPFATAKTIQVSRVLTLIEDGIATSQNQLGKKAVSESTVLSLLHGQVHMNLLQILATLMKSVNQNIITHSKSICDILWRCLKQTNSHEQMKFEANLKLRAATYDAFITFMRISPNNFYIKNVMENLIKEALADITPANDEIYLMMPQQNGGKSNKRKKVNADKKFAKGRTHIVTLNQEQKVCSKAMECLGYLLIYQGVLMKPVLFYIMQEKVVAIGFMIASKTQQDGDLYRDPHCRSRLTDLVGFMMSHPVHKMPVPINYGIAMLTKIKQDDPDFNVRETAAMNLYKAETAIHNRKDVFYFPPEYSDLRDTLQFNKQTITKFNEPTNKMEEVSNGKHAPIQDEVDLTEEDVADPTKAHQADESEKIEISDKSDSSDESEVEIVQTEQRVEVKEVSDGEPLEISDDEPVEQPQTVAPKAKRQSPRSAKPTPKKKQKVSNQNDEALLNELLADFDDELV